MGFTPFKIMFGSPPPPIILNLQAMVIAEADNRQLLDYDLEGFQWVHKHVLPKLHILYQTGFPPARGH